MNWSNPCGQPALVSLSCREELAPLLFLPPLPPTLGKPFRELSHLSAANVQGSGGERTGEMVGIGGDLGQKHDQLKGRVNELNLTLPLAFLVKWRHQKVCS